MLRATGFIILFFALATQVWGQLIVKNSSDYVVMQVDEQANVTIGSSDQHGMLTTYELKVITGAASGRVLKSDADGLASWGTDEVDDADADPTNETPQAGTAISTSGRTVSVKVDNSTIKVNGSDQLYADVSMTESDPVWSSDKAELRDNNSSTTPVNWLDIANRPAGLDDGDDDTNTDNQALHFNNSTRQLSLDRGGSVTIPDNVNDGDYIIGNEFPVGGNGINISNDRTVNHNDTSTQGSVNNSNRTVIQDVSLDGFGHVTGINSATLDKTESYHGRYVLNTSINSIGVNWTEIARITLPTGGVDFRIIAQVFGNVVKSSTSGAASLDIRLRLSTDAYGGSVGRVCNAPEGLQIASGTGFIEYLSETNINDTVILEAKITKNPSSLSVSGNVFGDDWSGWPDDDGLTSLSYLAIQW